MKYFAVFLVMVVPHSIWSQSLQTPPFSAHGVPSGRNQGEYFLSSTDRRTEADPVIERVEDIDSTAVAESDTGGVEEENTSWSFNANAEYEKTRIKKGVDLSGTSPVFNAIVSMSHQSGWNGQLTWASMLGSQAGPLDWSAGVGYSYSATGWLDLTAGVTHTKYLADSVNIISNLENSISLGVAANFPVINLGIGYDIYLGSDPASYWSATAGHTFDFESLTFGLSASVTYMSQTIDAARLDAVTVKMKKKKTAVMTTTTKTKVTLSGIGSYNIDLDIGYALGAGFKIYLNPSYVVTPKGEVSSKDKQLSWSAGVNYAAVF